MEKFELKPCPFCGNKDVELRQYQFVEDVNGVDVKVPKAPQINCGKCGTIFELSAVDAENFDKCKNGLIEAWNRRVSE